jgi:2-oxoglutarate ferredoxin oxidoreductase subunit beta
MCNWCPGCGNFGIWTAFKEAAAQEKWNNANTAIVAGIGCHGHINNFIELSSFEGLHGRAIPVATGIKLVNHRLNVVVFTGDGDCLAEGGNHFMHAARRNHDLTVILHDNAIYGLTTGQTSPRSPHGYKSKSTPTGNVDESVARSNAGAATCCGFWSDWNELSALMSEVMPHPIAAISAMNTIAMSSRQDHRARVMSDSGSVLVWYASLTRATTGIETFMRRGHYR